MLGRVLPLLLGAAWFCAATQARAQARAASTRVTPHAPRLRLTPLLGVAAPSGKAHAKLELADVTPIAVSMGADIAWGPVLPFDVGLFAVANLGLGAPDSCPQPSSSCTLAASGQLALRARYTFRAAERFSPWLALGAGVDLFQSTGETSETESSILYARSVLIQRRSTYWGPLGLALAGADYRLGRKLALGGLVGLSMGAFVSQKDAVIVDGDDESSSSGTLEPYQHRWLYLAGYVTFDVGL
jgi:hypothetical protein